MGKISEFIFTHPAHALPIVACFIAAVAIVIDRYRRLVKVFPLHGRAQFIKRIRDLVVGDKVQEAIALCDQYPDKPTAQIVKEGLLRAHLPEEMITDGLNLAVGNWGERIMSRTGFLSMLANVVTLLGLFGTVAGLIQSFEAVAFADPQQKSTLLSQGISTAMNATMMGLGVAIPCMVAFSYLMNKSNNLMGELDQDVLETVDIIRQRAYGVETKRVA